MVPMVERQKIASPILCPFNKQLPIQETDAAVKWMIPSTNANKGIVLSRSVYPNLLTIIYI